MGALGAIIAFGVFYFIILFPIIYCVASFIIFIKSYGLGPAIYGVLMNGVIAAILSVLIIVSRIVFDF